MSASDRGKGIVKSTGGRRGPLTTDAEKKQKKIVSKSIHNAKTFVTNTIHDVQNGRGTTTPSVSNKPKQELPKINIPSSKLAKYSSKVIKPASFMSTVKKASPDDIDKARSANPVNVLKKANAARTIADATPVSDNPYFSVNRSKDIFRNYLNVPNEDLTSIVTNMYNEATKTGNADPELLRYYKLGQDIYSGVYSVGIGDKEFNAFIRKSMHDETFVSVGKDGDYSRYESVPVLNLDADIPPITISREVYDDWRKHHSSTAAPAEFNEDGTIKSINEDYDYAATGFSHPTDDEIKKACLIYKIVEEINNKEKRELTKYAQHIAGWDTKANDSFPKVNHNLFTKLNKIGGYGSSNDSIEDLNKYPTVLGNSKQAKDTRSALLDWVKESADYTVNYLVYPFFNLKRGSTFHNALYNLGEVCDYVGRPTRALASSNVNIKYSGGHTIDTQKDWVYSGGKGDFMYDKTNIGLYNRYKGVSLDKIMEDSSDASIKELEEKYGITTNVKRSDFKNDDLYDVAKRKDILRQVKNRVKEYRAVCSTQKQVMEIAGELFDATDLTDKGKQRILNKLRNKGLLKEYETIKSEWESADKFDRPYQRFLDSFNTHESYEMDTGNTFKDLVGYTVLDPSILATFGTSSIAKNASRVSAKEALRTFTSSGGKTALAKTVSENPERQAVLNLWLKREYKTLGRAIQGADGVALRHYADQATARLADSGLIKHGEYDAYKETMEGVLHNMQASSGYRFASSMTNASNLIDQFDMVFLKTGLFVPYTVLKTAKGIKSIIRSNGRAAKFLTERASNAWYYAESAYKAVCGVDGKTGIFDFRHFMGELENMKAMDSSVEPDNVAYAKYKSGISSQIMLLKNTLDTFVRSTEPFNSKLATLNASIKSISKSKITSESASNVYQLEHIVKEMSKKIGPKYDAIRPVFDMYLNVIDDFKAKIHEAKLKEVGSSLIEIRNAKTIEQLNLAVDKLEKFNYMLPPECKDYIAIRSKEIKAASHDPVADILLFPNILKKSLGYTLDVQRTLNIKDQIPKSVDRVVSPVLTDVTDEVQKTIKDVQSFVDTLFIKDSKGATVGLKVNCPELNDLITYLSIIGNDSSKVVFDDLLYKLDKAIKGVKVAYRGDVSLLPDEIDLVNKEYSGFIYSGGVDMMRRLYAKGAREYYELVSKSKNPSDVEIIDSSMGYDLETKRGFNRPLIKHHSSEVENLRNLRARNREFGYTSDEGFYKRKKALREKLESTPVMRNGKKVGTYYDEYVKLVHEHSTYANGRLYAPDIINNLTVAVEKLHSIRSLDVERSAKIEDVNITRYDAYNLIFDDPSLNKLMTVLDSDDNPLSNLLNNYEQILDFAPNALTDKLFKYCEELSYWKHTYNAFAAFKTELQNKGIPEEVIAIVIDKCLGLGSYKSSILQVNSKKMKQVIAEIGEVIDSCLGTDFIYLDRYIDTVLRESHIDSTIWNPKHLDDVEGCHDLIKSISEDFTGSMLNTKFQMLQLLEIHPEIIPTLISISKNHDVIFINTESLGLNKESDVISRISMQKLPELSEDMTLSQILDVVRDSSNENSFDHEIKLAEENYPQLTFEFLKSYYKNDTTVFRDASYDDLLKKYLSEHSVDSKNSEYSESALLDDFINAFDKSIEKKGSRPVFVVHDRTGTSISSLKSRLDKNGKASRKGFTAKTIFNSEELNSFDILKSSANYQTVVGDDDLEVIRDAITNLALGLPSGSRMKFFDVNRFSKSYESILKLLSGDDITASMRASTSVNSEVETDIFKVLRAAQNSLKWKIEHGDMRMVDEVYDTYASRRSSLEEYRYQSGIDAEHEFLEKERKDSELFHRLVEAGASPSHFGAEDYVKDPLNFNKYREGDRVFDLPFMHEYKLDEFEYPTNIRYILQDQGPWLLEEFKAIKEKSDKLNVEFLEKEARKHFDLVANSVAEEESKTVELLKDINDFNLEFDKVLGQVAKTQDALPILRSLFTSDVAAKLPNTLKDVLNNCVDVIDYFGLRSDYVSKTDITEFTMDVSKIHDLITNHYIRRVASTFYAADDLNNVVFNQNLAQCYTSISALCLRVDNNYQNYLLAFNRDNPYINTVNSASTWCITSGLNYSKELSSLAGKYNRFNKISISSCISSSKFEGYPMKYGTPELVREVEACKGIFEDVPTYTRDLTDDVELTKNYFTTGWTPMYIFARDAKGSPVEIEDSFLKKSVSKLNDQINTLVAQKSTIESNIELADGRIKFYLKHVDSSSQNIEAINRKLADAYKRLADIKPKVSLGQGNEKELRNLKTSIDNLEKRIANIKKINQARRDRSERFDLLTVSYTDLYGYRDAATLSKFEETLSSLVAKYEVLRKSVPSEIEKRIRSEIDDLNNELKVVTDEHNKQLLAGAEDKYKAAFEARDSYRLELDGINKKLADARSERSRLLSEHNTPHNKKESDVSLVGVSEERIAKREHNEYLKQEEDRKIVAGEASRSGVKREVDTYSRHPVAESSVTRKDLLAMIDFSKEVKNIVDNKLKDTVLINTYADDWFKIIDRAKQICSVYSRNDAHHFMVHLKNPQTTKEAFAMAYTIYNRFFKLANEIEERSILDAKNNLNLIPYAYKDVVSEFLDSGSDVFKLDKDCTVDGVAFTGISVDSLKLLKGDGLSLVMKYNSSNYLDRVTFISKLSDYHSVSANLDDILQRKNMRKRVVSRFGLDSRAPNEIAFDSLEDSQIVLLNLLNDIFKEHPKLFPYCRKYLDNVKSEMRSAYSFQILDYITASYDNLVTHLLFHNQLLVVAENGSPEYVKYIDKLNHYKDFKHLHFVSKNGYLWIGFKNDVKINIKGDSRFIDDTTKMQIDGESKVYDSKSMSDAYKNIEVSGSALSDKLLSKLSDEDIELLNGYLAQIKSYIVSCYDRLDYLTNGAIKGSMITPYNRAYHMELYKSAPAEFLSDALKGSTTFDQRLFHSSQFNMSVIGEEGYALKRGYYDDSDILQDIKQCYDDLAGTVSTERMYIGAYFDVNSHCKLTSLLNNCTVSEKLEILKANPDQCVVALVRDPSNTSGFRVKKIKITDELSVQVAESYDAIVVPYDVYIEMQRLINDSTFNKTYLRIWSTIMLMLKVGHLCNPGTWLRNWQDATLKCIGETGEIGDTALGQVKAMKYLMDYNKLLRYVRKNEGITEATDSRLRNTTDFKRYAEEAHVTMSKRQFEFVESWLRVSLSGGESGFLTSLIRKQKYGTHSSGNLRRGDTSSIAGRRAMQDNFDVIGSDIVRCESLSDSEIESLIQDAYKKDMNIFPDGFTYNDFKRVLKEHREGSISKIGLEYDNYKRVWDDLLKIRNKRRLRFSKKPMDKINYMGSFFLTPMSKIEQVVRLGQFLTMEQLGYTKSQIFKSIADSQFDYALKSSKVKQAELVMTYANFEYSNLAYWCRQFESNPEFMYGLEKLWNITSWQACRDYYEDEEAYNNPSLMNMMNNGGLPIGSSGLYMKVLPSSLSALNWFYAMPSQYLTSVIPPAETLSKELMYLMGGHYAEVLNNLDYSYADKTTFEKAIDMVPIAGTLYTRYYVPTFETKPWVRLDGTIIPQALVKYNPTVFGAIQFYNQRHENDFDAFQKKLKKQGKWYDSNLDRVVDRKYKNKDGLNNPNLSFKELEEYKAFWLGEYWDSNWMGFKKETKDLKRGRFGLNRDFNFLTEPNDWDEYCSLELKYHGRKWCNNSHKFIPITEWKNERLNRDDLTTEEFFHYMNEDGYYWDAKDKKFKQIPEVMHAYNSGYYYRGWRNFRRWVNYNSNPPADKNRVYSGGLYKIKNRPFGMPYTSTSDYSALRMAVSGYKAYDDYYKFEYNSNYSYRNPNPMSSVKRYNPILRYHIAMR